MYKIKARLDITAIPPVVVDPQLCDLCGGCVGVCPPNCIAMSERILSIIGADCIKCGFCIPACPVEALSWNETEFRPNGHKSQGDDSGTI